MKKETLLERLKRFLGSIGWKLFIWGNNFTQEEYWERIYRQEKEYKKRQKKIKEKQLKNLAL